MSNEIRSRSLAHSAGKSADTMKRDRFRQHGKASLELIEEAIHLLRLAPMAHLSVYYTGTLPFVLAALYFWADMSRSPFAGQHLVGGALALAGLFLWMKTCQCLFSYRMRCLASNENAHSSLGQIGRVFLTQAAVQPTGLFLLPVTLVLTIPFPWVFAFYQNLSALDEGKAADFSAVLKKAAAQARLWPQQNHVMLAIMGAFGLFVGLNLLTACFLLPNLVKVLFGVESVFTRSELSLLNSTFFFATFGLAYLCTDPILKTIYALRCFYGESRSSGADLRAELRRAGMLSALALLLALAALGLALLPSAGEAAEPPPASVPLTERPAAADAGELSRSSARAAQLDQTIQQVIQQPKYAWRQPRQKLVEPGDQERGFFGRLLDRIKPFLKRTVKAIGEWLDRLLRRWFGSRTIGQGSFDASRWVALLHLLLYALIAAAALGLAWLLYRLWKDRHRTVGSVASEPLAPIPDLSDENLGAEQLPEEGWMKVGHELLAEGKLRLALRAFYLASLAQLASKNLIQLARFKSNSDYERELRKRAHALPGLAATFGDNSQLFDRSWYGRYELNPDVVTGFAANVERMRAAGTAPPPNLGLA